MLDLVSKVISDWRVITIFIVIALYLQFVGFVASYRKNNNLRKATVRRAPKVEEAPPSAEAPAEEEAAEEVGRDAFSP